MFRSSIKKPRAQQSDLMVYAFAIVVPVADETGSASVVFTHWFRATANDENKKVRGSTPSDSRPLTLDVEETLATPCRPHSPAAAGLRQCNAVYVRQNSLIVPCFLTAALAAAHWWKAFLEAYFVSLRRRSCRPSWTLCGSVGSRAWLFIGRGSLCLPVV